MKYNINKKTENLYFKPFKPKYTRKDQTEKMYCRTKQIGSQLKHAELFNKKRHFIVPVV